ncbi:MAG: hypothetical protein AB7O26_18700 [Planctomycetaceae bacterium]
MSGATSAESRPPAVIEEDRGSTEAAYLETEIACTQVAIRNALERLRHHVADVADPHELMQKHPWASLSAALSAGFITAATVVPRKGESVTEKWSRLKSHLPEPPNTDGHETKESGSAIKTAIATFLMTYVTEIGRMVAEKFLHPDSHESEGDFSDDAEEGASYGPEGSQP